MTRTTAFVLALFLTMPLLGQIPNPSLERVLLPVFTPPVHGAFASEFHTDLRIWNAGENTITLNGLLANCVVTCIEPPDQPFDVPSRRELTPEDFSYSGTPGRFIYVPKAGIEELSMNLRVHDVSRGGLNYGTEMPIVRESEFVINRIVLVGIPTDPRFRNTLRIYSTGATDVIVTVNDQAPVRVALQKTADVFDPAYGVFTQFPTGTAPVRVTIQTDPNIVTLLPIEVPLWAFVTVTNNETQVISTITPQP